MTSKHVKVFGPGQKNLLHCNFTQIDVFKIYPDSFLGEETPSYKALWDILFRDALLVDAHPRDRTPILTEGISNMGDERKVKKYSPEYLHIDDYQGC